MDDGMNIQRKKRRMIGDEGTIKGEGVEVNQRVNPNLNMSKQRRKRNY